MLTGRHEVHIYKPWQVCTHSMQAMIQVCSAPPPPGPYRVLFTCSMPRILHSTPSPGCTEPPAMMANARLSLRCHNRILQQEAAAAARKGKGGGAITHTCITSEERTQAGLLDTTATPAPAASTADPPSPPSVSRQAGSFPAPHPAAAICAVLAPVLAAVLTAAFPQLPAGSILPEDLPVYLTAAAAAAQQLWVQGPPLAHTNTCPPG